MISYGTVCSGVGAPEQAVIDFGWQCSFMSEIDKFPRAVLRQRFPGHPLHGDFTTIQRGTYASVDALIGGTPCQDFSLAGKRLGLDAPRGNLALEYLSLARRLGVKWVVWENVPGMLSSWSDDEVIETGPMEGSIAGDGTTGIVRQRNDFATFLDFVGQCGFGYAWRVLDGKHFGVPQQRRRIILIGYIGDWRPAAAVLFERESLRRDITPRRQARSGVARSITSSIGGVSAKEQQHTFVAGEKVLNALDVAHSLRADGFDASEDGSGRGTPLVPDIAWALQERDYKGADSDTKEGHLIPVAFDCKASGSRGFNEGSIAPSLRSMSHDDSHANGGGQIAIALPPVAFKIRGGCEGGGKGYLGAENSAFTLSITDDQHLFDAMRVRRLTPRECERLMGFPDDFTLINYGGKPATDGPRYKALGNSMIVPKMRWILERLDRVNQIIGE